MLSSQEAHRIIKSVHFPGEENLVRNEKICQASKTTRRKLITHHGKTEEQKIAAAVEIQRIWRGFWTRLRLASILQAAASYQGTVIQKPTRVSSGQSLQPLHGDTEGGEGIPHHKPLRSFSATSSRKKHLNLRYQRYLEKAAQHGSSEVISYEEFCAHFIQNWWSKVKRKHAVRDHSSKLSTPSPVKSVSIIMSPSGMRVSSTTRYQPKKKKREGPLESEEAATIIQTAWRRHIDIQVYRYYRDLINFRCCGDPALMLRCINPREAQLLDAAAGIHIKFRLAGSKFPPNIYYKIFTHRNIVDMCANSPKNYTDAAVKRKEAKDVHNRRRTKETQREDSKVGWYQRMENNGWRLVSDRLILKADQDPVTWESSKRTQEFHHSKLKRKADVERKKRRRKLEWMQKMYRDGMTEAKSKAVDTESLVEGAAAGMLAVMDEKGPDAIEDWEVDELLEWTDGLNFDDYLTDWQAIATSASSEKITDDPLKFNTTLSDPFEFSLSVDSPPMAASPSHPSTGKRAPMPTPLKTDVAVM